VLYDDLGPVERKRLHRAISSHVPDGATLRMGLLEWARHVTEGASPGDGGAVDAALQAADATRRAAPLSAARWYQRALDLLAPDAPQVPALLARQTVAYWKGSRPEDAVAAGRRALSVLPRGRLHDITLASVVNALYAMGRLTEAVALLDAALPQVEGRAPFLAQRAVVLAHLGRTDQANRQLREARSAVAASAPEDRAIGYSFLGHAETSIGTYAQVAAAADQLEALGTGSSVPLPPGARLSALESAAYFRSVAGELRRGQTLLAQAAELAAQSGFRDIGGQTAYATATTQFLAGQWSQALETIQSETVRLEFSGLTSNLTWMRFIEVRILLERGQYGDAGRLLDAVEPPAEWAVYAAFRDCVRGRIALACKDYDTALARLRRQCDVGLENRWCDVAHSALESLAAGLREIGDERGARRAAEQLAELAGSVGTPKIRHSADLALALAHRQPQLACGVLEEATAEGLPFVAARAHHVLATLGHDREEHLHRALELFGELGAPVWQKLVLAQAREAGLLLGRAHRPATDGGELTDTERQLVQLVHDGLSNQEISQVLHYSRKTVEAYLSRLYRKTGCRSRVELVVALERGGLVPARANR
jgi:DNA-binding NarL/FixJ family response regulator